MVFHNSESWYDLKDGDHNQGGLHTGDLAKMDEDGCYYIVGRIKRFLKMYGNRVSLDEIEDLVRSAGYDCVCAGTDDNLKIYITEPDDKDRIMRYIAKHTGINRAGFSFAYIDKIPRNNSGKVQYSSLN